MMRDHLIYVNAVLVFILLVQFSHGYREEIEENDDEDESAYDKIVKINQGHKELFEADIHIESFPENLKKSPYSHINSKLLKRGLRREAEYLWVERVVPYVLTPAVEHGREMIESAMRELEEQSCIKFKKRHNEKHWVQIVDEGACFSGVGRAFWREGSQKLSLARGCMQKGTIMHELLHTLGFWHEQSRPDRDKYVEIFWENVKEGEEHNFAKYGVSQLNSRGVNYDVNSIMHYGKYSFSKNGEPTILAINNAQKSLGQRVGLSKEDAIQLNLLYRCKDIGHVYTGWSEWSPCDSDFHCKSSRQRFCSAAEVKHCPEASMYGVHTEYRTCPDDECYRPVNGHWNRWSAWSTCDKTCGHGRKTRTRKCDDPKPKHGGNKCSKERSQTVDCYIVPCGLGQDDCQFDAQGMCFWKDVSSISFKWRRRKGKTPSSKTGPMQDHSNGKGYYLFTESSAPAETGMKANLISKVFPGTRGRCMKFAYSMHGANMGNMRVYIVKEESGEEIVAWETRGPQGEDWLDGNVFIQMLQPYRIKFQAERGVSFLSDMALDDVQFTAGTCGNTLEGGATLPPATLKPTTQPRTTEPPLHGICSMRIKPLGCFAEIPHQPALPILLDNHRGPGKAFHNKQLQWDRFPESLNSLLCDCIHLAKSRGIRYIGMQYYGECWGLDEGRHYDKYGISTLCVDGKFKPCYHQNYQQVCVGKAMTNYIYEVL